MTTNTPGIARALPAFALAAGLALSAGACGNGDSKGADAPGVSHAESSLGKPGATLALRRACVSTNKEIVAANASWNSAVESRKSADLAKATTSMTSLAATLRKAGTTADDTSFKTKADAAATQVDTLRKSSKPSKTVDTRTYNDAVDALTSYCSSMFPQASPSGG